MKRLVFECRTGFLSASLPACLSGSVLRIFVLSWVLLTALPARVVAMEPASTDSIVTQVAVSYRYDKRVHRYRMGWDKLIPTHTALQYAGSIGFLSAGFGWDYGKHRQWETTLLFGYLPRYNSDKGRLTFTLKQNYTPWSRNLTEQLSVEPLTCGLFFNTIASDEFWTNEPDRYPKGYYGFSTRVRTHLFLGQRLTWNIDHSRDRRLLAKSITAYYELSTCDLYVVSAFTNRYLKPHDILSLAFGVKVQLF